MRRFRRIASSFGLAMSAWMVLADFAYAANLSWNNAAGGFAGTAGNWNPAQVPAAADFLSFGLNNIYTVTFGVNVPTSAELLVEDGEVTYRFPNAHTNSTVLGIAQNGLSAELTIESGTLTLQQNLFMAATAGHTGTLNVTGAGTALVASSPTGVTSIAEQGTGTINVVDGASMTVANSPEFGDRAGGSGTLIVGGVSATSPFPRSRLTVNNTSTDPMELGSNGTGTGGVLFGGQMDVSRSIQLGKNVGGVGSLVVAGVGGSDSARVNVGGDLKIARNDVAGVGAGAGTFTVGSGGVADVAGNTYTFDADGSTGTLEIDEGGRFETGALFVGNPATELDFAGGRLQVRGGTLDLDGNPLVINSSTGSPTLELHDNAQAIINSATAPALNVGENANGTLKVLFGSDLTVHDFNAVVGDDPGGTGTLELNHAGSSLTVDQTLLVGRAGTGLFSAGGGSQATFNSLGIGTQPSGNGTVKITDAGTEAHVTDLLELAGLSGGASLAPGVLEVTDNADLWLDRPIVSGHVWDTGTLNVETGGELHLAGTLVTRGIVDLSGGQTSGGVIEPIGGGRITGSGAALSSIVAVGDTTGHIVPGPGPLTLGNASSPLGFHFLGRLDAPIGDVTLADADSAVVGTVSMIGGVLHGPPGGIHLTVDRRMTGFGTVTGPIRPVGRIISSGASGISFTGPVLGVGQGMNGTRFRFQPGGSFIGFGRIEASIQVDTGAVILPTNDLTLGKAPLASSVTIDGTLAAGPGVEVDLNGTDSTRVTGAITLADGFVGSSTSPLVTRSQARISGNGALLVDTFNAGTIDPGPGLNNLRFQKLTMSSASRVVFEVGNYAAGELDTLSSDNQVFFAGTLDIRTLPGYVPVAGDSFLVMSYPARAGGFGTVTINGGPSTGLIQVLYRPTGAYARILAGPVAVDEPPAAAPRAVQLSSLGSPSRALAFALELPEAAEVALEVFDVAGRRVATLHDGALPPGRHRFDAGLSARAAGGLYIARATVSGPHGTIVRTARSVRVP